MKQRKRKDKRMTTLLQHKKFIIKQLIRKFTKCKIYEIIHDFMCTLNHNCMPVNWEGYFRLLFLDAPKHAPNSFGEMKLNFTIVMPGIPRSTAWSKKCGVSTHFCFYLWNALTLTVSLVSSGVPQGSVLGRILFLLFIMVSLTSLVLGTGTRVPGYCSIPALNLLNCEFDNNFVQIFRYVAH